MTNDPTAKELIVELRGSMETLRAELSGDIKALTQEVRAANTARAAEVLDLRKDSDDHEARLRVLEARKTVAPMTLWSVVGGVLTLVLAGIGVVLNALD